MEYVTIEEVEEAYYDCRKHKRRKRSALEYEMNYELNNCQLWRDLNNCTYEVSTCVCFYVTRPKLREVFCADFRDRIVHHLIMRKFLWMFEADMIEDSYNCRVGKGVLYGVKRLSKHIADVSCDYSREAFCLCIDLKGFFMSIDRDILYSMLEHTIRAKYHGGDIEWWLWLIKKVVYHRPELDCDIRGDISLKDKIDPQKSLFHSGGKGLPIGNLSSQIFANYYMTAYDRWICSKLSASEKYSRYVDDIRIVGTDKTRLLQLLYESRIWLNKNLHVQLHPNKVGIQSVHKGVPFIGSVIKPHRMYAGKNLVNGAFSAVADWNKDKNSTRYLQHHVQRVNSYLGFLVHYNSYAIRWRLWQGIHDKNMICAVNMKKLQILNKYNKLVQIEKDGILTAEWVDINYDYELHQDNNRKESVQKSTEGNGQVSPSTMPCNNQ